MARGETWTARAERLGVLIPRSSLHPSVLAWVSEPTSSKGWGIALSGGSDSVSLLLLLWQHFPERRASMTAIHFNHRLRGTASSADAHFCRSLAKDLGISYAEGEWKNSKKGVSEEAARLARFSFFESVCKKRRIHSLWFGHQQDDVAETILMRLARGSGSGGLAAPRPVQVGPAGRRHVRPLLGLKKAAIEHALRKAGVPWRKDETNMTDQFFRNRVRNRVLPAWTKAAGRDAVAGAALSRDRLEEDDKALESWADRLALFTPACALRLTALQGAPKAIYRRALHRWLLLQPKAGGLSRQGFDVLLEAVMLGKPTRHSLGRQGFAVVKHDRLTFKFTRN